MSGAGQDAYRQAAAAYLRELLLRPGRYRRRWEQHAERSRPGQVNQLAVAEVLARYRWDHPRAEGDADVLPRQLKDTVLRALSGKMLSRSTLALFVEAFGFSDMEAEQLRRLWAGSSRISVLSGPRALQPAMHSRVADVLGPPISQTVSLHDHINLGADGLIIQARTLKVVEATADGVDRVPYIHDTDALTLEVGQGCKGVSGYLHRIGDDLYLTEIVLAKELALGETLTLEYWTTYHYADDQMDEAKRQYRRAVMGRLENFDIRVEFHPARMPKEVWWAVWDGIDGDVISQESVTPDSQHSVHRYMRFLERTVVGFHWTWLPACGDGDRAWPLTSVG
ncbi:MAG TPA: hypothetical protein VGM53_01065 [Streptosporangiaceae bacterium]